MVAARDSREPHGAKLMVHEVLPLEQAVPAHQKMDGGLSRP
jgi:hypothetical protein